MNVKNLRATRVTRAALAPTLLANGPLPDAPRSSGRSEKVEDRCFVHSQLAPFARQALPWDPVHFSFASSPPRPFFLAQPALPSGRNRWHEVEANPAVRPAACSPRCWRAGGSTPVQE